MGSYDNVTIDLFRCLTDEASIHNKLKKDFWTYEICVKAKVATLDLFEVDLAQLRYSASRPKSTLCSK